MILAPERQAATSGFRRISLRFAVVFALLFAIAAPALFADDVDESAMFGGDDSSPSPSASPGSPSASPAATGSNVQQVGNAQDSFKENFLTDQAVRIGGSYNFDIGTKLWWPDFVHFDSDWISDNTKENYALDLDASLFFSARPSDTTHFYGKVKTSYPFSVTQAVVTDVGLSPNPNPLTAGASPQVLTVGSTSITVPQFSIYELYSDFAIGDNVLFKVGKQAAKWGVGYFWSPADIISLTPVDLSDPTAEREGPVALKANVAFGLDSVDFYVIAGDTVKSLLDLGLASRAVIYIGDFEWGIGAGYQRDRSLQLVSTIAGSIGPVNVFGEARVSNGSIRRILKVSDSDPSQVEVESFAPTNGWADDWFFAGTVGGSWSGMDPAIGALTVIAQYYFNSEGYADSSILSVQDIGLQVYGLIAANKISASDLFELGQHYTALSLNFSPGSQTDFSVSALWIANWSDLSGQISPGISIKIVDNITLAITSSFVYGAENTEYVGVLFTPPGGDQQRLDFRNPYGRMTLGFSLNMGSGNF